MVLSQRACVRVYSFLFTLLTILLLMAGITMAATPKPRPRGQYTSTRVTQSIDESKLVILSGNTRPEANAQNDRGPLPDTFSVEHVLLLLQRSPQQEQELKALIDSLNDRNSPNFHRWLTADQFGQQFGVAQEDIDTVTGWLESQGFRINKVYTSGMTIDFSGTAGQLRKAFHTDMHQLQVNGEQHIANMNDPSIPSALAPVIKGIFSLHDFKPHKMLKPRPAYTFAGCASSTDSPTEPGTCYAMTPADNWTIYGLTPLFNAGYSGQGQTIALVEDTDSYGTDFQSYRNAFGLNTAYPAGNLITAHPGGCTDPGTNADDSEADLDVEIASAIAPNATIELISCGDGTVTFGGLTALQNLINGGGPYPGVVSVSYGECEVINGSGGNAAFNSTYQQAAAEGISVFGASGDEGPSSCSVDFGTSSGSYPYDVTSLGVSGWTDTPYNVAVGGTDFEDTYNFKTGQNGGAALSTYWSATNSSNNGSALQYVPEIPWNDSCASTLIAEVANGSFTTYGTSGTCGKSPWDTTSAYLSSGAGSGGASNCATGFAANSTNATDQYDYLITTPDCQGYAKPSWQSAYGVPSDGVRDIPDVSMFAANGVWGHYEVVCWSDPAYSSDGSVSCSGAPSTWSGFGGTSVASPTMAAIQALVNQKTGENWGNPNSIYYQIAQSEYGTQGGSFLGSSCNSSTGSGTACVFNDVTQGDIDLACETNGSTEEAHCYDYSKSGRTTTYGVDSTDNVTGVTIVNGGTGYTSAPTCTIAGPTNNQPYKSPTGTTLWAGGTQATCSATVSTGTTTGVWTVLILSADAADGMTVNVGSQVITLTGSSTTAIASALSAAINSGSTIATATVSSSTVTITSKTAGYAGNFNVSFGGNATVAVEDAVITNTTIGQGPNYVSGVTIIAAGSGYQPDTPITFTGGGGSGALALANTTPGTAAQSYQPAYGAAPGYDMATGLGSVNAYNLACNSAWGSTCVTSVSTSTAVSSSANPSTYGTGVSWTATITPSAATGSVQFVVDGSSYGSPVTVSGGTATSNVDSTLSVANHTVAANFTGTGSYTSSTGTLSGGQTVSQASTSTAVSVNPTNEDYGADSPVTITAVVSWSGSGSAPTASAVTIGGNGNGTYSGTTCGAASGNTLTCTATYTPTTADTAGSYSETASFAGDGNYTGSSNSTSFTINGATSTTTLSSSGSPSVYGQPVTFTATVTGENGAVKGRTSRKNGVKSQVVTGTVTWSGNTSCGTTPVNSGSGTATCTTTMLPEGSDNVTATYNGDGNHGGSSGSIIQSVSQATTSIAVSVNPTNEDFGADSPVTITAVLSWTGQGAAPTASAVTISGNGPNTYGATTCGAPSGDTLTCTATYTPTTADAAGSYTETATFAGDTNYTTSNNSAGFTINGATSTTSVTSNPNPSTYATSVTFTATVTGENGAVTRRTTRKNGVKSQDITGSVTWSSNTGCGPSTVSGYPGVATCTTSSATHLPVGNDTVTATYSGDSNHSGSTGSVIQQVTGGIATTINVTSVNPTNEDFGADTPVTITAVLSWTGNGVAPTASDITIGGNGSGTYSATSCSPRSGETITCTATYTPTNADVAGSYNETAAFSGDTNYAGSTSPQTGNFTINGATSSTVVTSGLNPSTYGQSVTFTATVSGENGAIRGNATRKNGVKSQDVTGTVTWSSNTGCSASTVSGYPGVATCTTTSLAGGSDTVTANYSGDSNHGASSGSFDQTVNPASQTINVTGVPASAVYGTTFNVSASASSGLTVALTSAGGCSNSGSTYTMTSGTTACSVIANQAGNNNYSAAATVTKSVAATKATPTVTFTGLPSSLPYNTTDTLATTTNASTVATITGSTPTVCSLSGSVVTVVADTGTCTVTAQWAADANYVSATRSQSGTATKGVPAITWNTPAPITYGTPLSATQLDAGANIAGTFTYSPSAGKYEAAGNVTLTATFTPSSKDYGRTTATVTLVVQQAPTTTTISSADQTVSLNASGSASATVHYNVNSYKPTGSMTLTASTGESCTGTVAAATGNGACKLTFTSTGTRTITATYAGDANHTGSNNSSQSPAITVTVNPHE